MLSDPSGEPTRLRYAIAKRDTRGNGRAVYISERHIGCEVDKPSADIMFSLLPGPPTGYGEVQVDAWVTTRVKQRTATRALLGLNGNPRRISINEDWVAVKGEFDVKDCPDVVAAEPQPPIDNPKPLRVEVPHLAKSGLVSETDAVATLGSGGIQNINVNLGGENERRLSINLTGARDQEHRALMLTPQPAEMAYGQNRRFDKTVYGWIRFIHVDLVNGSRFAAEIGASEAGRLEATGIIEGVVKSPTSAAASASSRQ